MPFIFDLTESVTVTKPDTGDRYQSMVVIDRNHYARGVVHDSGEYPVMQDAIGTRFCLVLFGTFVDSTDPDDGRTV